MTSFNLNYLQKTLSPDTLTMAVGGAAGVRASTYEHNSVHSIIRKYILKSITQYELQIRIPCLNSSHSIF